MHPSTAGLLLIIAMASAIDVTEYQHVPEPKPIVPILKQNFEQHHQGYQFSYEAGNGINVQESGYFKPTDDEKTKILVKQGTVTYHDEHGNPITLSYVADEHGFQPQGTHLPTPPPIPEEIQKSLDVISQQQQYEEAEGGEELGQVEEYQHYQ